jgi:Protein of unknown function (DUF3052)
MSDKSVAQKLGMKAGKTMFVAKATTAVPQLLGAIPEGAAWVDKGAGPFPLVLLFAKDRASLVKELSACKSKLAAGGALWVAYAKGSSTKVTDINRDTIREYVTTVGLDTVGIIAIDEDWSALRLKMV